MGRESIDGRLKLFSGDFLGDYAFLTIGIGDRIIFWKI